MWQAAYRALAVPAARALLPAAGVLDAKIGAYLRARRDWRSALVLQIAARPRVARGGSLWVHAASAGEFLQARALLAALAAARPDSSLVCTYTSPSAAPLLEGFDGADLVFPLPLDAPGNARAWLDAVRPAALALVDAELWPGFLRECARRSVPVALVSARLGEASRRRRPLVRGFYRALYRELDVVCCVDESSRARFAAAGVPAARLRVPGDLRIDETRRRAAAAARGPDAALPSRVAGSPAGAAALVHAGALPIVVAGSTWPRDEAVLLPALEWLRDRGDHFWLTVAPHDVAEPRLRELERALEGAGFTSARWSALEQAATVAPAPPETLDSMIVDRVGLLHRLYATAAVSYVGGGFGEGLHNVMEPAAFGIPIVVGPATGKAWIAEEMVRACGLFPITDAAACAAVLGHLLREPASAAEAGARARSVIAAHAGAAERTLEALGESGWLPQERAAAGSAPKNLSGGTLAS